MADTIKLDIPDEYWKPLNVRGVSRDGENEKAVIVSFTRGLSDGELRRLHEFLRTFAGPAASLPA